VENWFQNLLFQMVSTCDRYAAVAIALCSLTSAVTLFAAAVMYQRKLKPRLIKKCLKDK
jgi:hypothetical protein